jgi:hypothetical protein
MGGISSTGLSSQDAKVDRKADTIARCFVWRIQAMVARVKRDDRDTVRVLSFNEMHCLAKRMLIAREEFRALDKPVKVITRRRQTWLVFANTA